MASIQTGITVEQIKKILGNRAHFESYLTALNTIKPVAGLQVQATSSGDSLRNYPLRELHALATASWDYEISKGIIRDLFTNSSKFKSGKSASTTLARLISEWEALDLGEVTWPFSQGAFDTFVQSVNARGESGSERDVVVKEASVRYRRIKEINTVRNDFIETLVFEQSDKIIPTLSHRRGLDFYIDGVSYDQKVSRSTTNEFKADYGPDWRQAAINHPEKVAEYLYAHQDEGRFGADSRLLVIYLDETVSAERIEALIQATDFTQPHEISFSFNHKTGGPKVYSVTCFVVLLYN